MKKINKIQDLKIGQKVKVKRVMTRDEKKRYNEVRQSVRMKLNEVYRKEVKGEVMSVDEKRGIFIIEKANGEQEVIDLVKFIVEILPLIEALIDGIERIWNKIFKKK